MYEFQFYFTPAAYCDHQIFLEFIALVVFNGDYKLRNSASECGFTRCCLLRGRSGAHSKALLAKVCGESQEREGGVRGFKVLNCWRILD